MPTVYDEFKDLPAWSIVNQAVIDNGRLLPGPLGCEVTYRYKPPKTADERTMHHKRVGIGGAAAEVSGAANELDDLVRD